VDIGAKVAGDPFQNLLRERGTRDGAAASLGSSEEVFFAERLLNNRLEMRIFRCNRGVSKANKQTKIGLCKQVR
jgi:hypothetical protein